MMDYETLKSELTADPAGLGYANMTDASAAAALNAQSRTTPVSVQTRDVRRYLFLNDLFLPVTQAAQAGKASASTLIAALENFDSFDMGDSAVAAKVASVLDGLIADGILTDGNKQDLIGLGQQRTSRAQEIGWPLVTDNDVAHARSL